MYFHRIWAGLLVVFVMVWFIGGCSEEEETTVIAPIETVTTSAKLMAIPRSSFNLIELPDTNNCILIAGGKDTGGTKLRLGETYDPTTGVFASIQCPMIDVNWGSGPTHARNYVSSISEMPAASGSIFIGGFGPCEIYDVSAMTFTQIAGVPPSGDYPTGWNGLC